MSSVVENKGGFGMHKHRVAPVVVAKRDVPLVTAETGPNKHKTSQSGGHSANSPLPTLASTLACWQLHFSTK